ncbi:hypothetical protein [Cellulomonas oligotrophica]|uniref:Right handed beta helix domain-containing protein n=1 Tax=Cellulomonas oligotrophica TaxID=931536 RepID=A0A7Y9FGX5_9CELL|nr:hypothetical protein [Cellulomonas oligotrophica]NYD86968.1 hypothetical protein [Cellulomonas oligotrophica]GIG32246.1 hypothetical protein Col01nite_14050 [Cellulomonas oligotrophica]
MRTSTALPALVLAVGATLVAGPAQAAPPGPACGEHLTVDTVLTRNLTCTSGDGLTLAPGVTLDLGGKVLTGHDTGRGVVGPPTGDVTVTNGVVTGWGTGVTADDLTGTDPETGDDLELDGTVHVVGVVVRGNGTGVDGTGRLYDSFKTFAVDRSTLRGNGTGFSTVGGYGTFTRTTLRDNDVALYANTGGVRLERSVVRDNGTGFDSGGEAGIDLVSTAFLGNDVGIRTGFMDFVTVERSELSRNGTAIDHGPGGSYLRVQDTTFASNGTGVAAHGDEMAITGSTFRKNDVGVSVEPDSWPDAPWERVTSIVGNTFVDGGDGLLSQWEGAQIGDNSATGNDRWGIHAPGADDLGLNSASGNGNEPQCVGVVCAPTAP